MGADAPRHKYLICNADEMEPGSFKDRLLMEGVPHQLIEGMIVSAYAIQASRGYIFLRGEYVLAAERLNRAIAEARDAGYLGANVRGSPWSFELVVHTSAGRYICGEETALINSLEGRRANPRAKPPFPQIAGLWGKPTVVNNVETLSNVPHIVLRGVPWFNSLSQGKSQDTGTKLYGVSGRVKRPGVWELAVRHQRARDSRAARRWHERWSAAQVLAAGGASTEFLLPQHLDLAMDFNTIAKAGSRLGTGLMTVVDDTQSILPVVRNLEEFFARRVLRLVHSLPRWSAVERQNSDRAGTRRRPARRPRNPRALTRFLGPGTTFCALAPGAMEPLQSALKFFRPEFEAGIARPASQAVA